MSASDNKRIMKNSIALYVRMLFTMGLNLLITRFVLRYLGVDDYGTYSAVGGIVTLFTVFNGGISKANQRFITYELGKRSGHPHKTFNTIINLTLLIALVTVLVIEIAGLWFLYHKMNIPEERMNAAFWIFQFSVVIMAVSLVSNPYNALIISHEKIGAFAYISILQVVLNFIAAWCLRYVLMDKLIYYGLMVMLVHILIRAIYQIYCRNHFKESKHRLYMNGQQVKSIAKFTGWATVDGAFGTIIWQGITILINVSYGVTINAVYQISGQLKNAVLSFAQNVQRAMDPQITKSYAAGDLERHHALVFSGSKLEVFMLYFIIIPLLARTEFILKLWLGNDLPEHLVTFCRLAVLMNLICSAFEVLRTSVMATGNLRKLALYPNLLHLSVLPVCYIANLYFHSPVIMMVIITIIYFFVYAYRFYIASQISKFSLKKYFIKIVSRCLSVGALSAVTVFALDKFIPDNIWGFLLLLICSTIILLVYIYILGLSVSERNIARKCFLKAREFVA